MNSEPSTVDSVCLLETNIDDSSGEIIGSVVESAFGGFDAGVLDCFTTPIYMKHNRPAFKLSVLCEIKDEERISHFLFEQGLTLGIRRQILQRRKLKRDFAAVSTPFGAIRIKTGRLDGKIVFCKPEFSDCLAAAQKHNVSVKAVIDAALAGYKRGEK